MKNEITLAVLRDAVENTNKWPVAYHGKNKDGEFDCFIYQMDTVCECLECLREILEVMCVEPETINMKEGCLTYFRGEAKIHLFFPKDMEQDVDFMVKEIYDDYFKDRFCSLE